MLEDFYVGDFCQATSTLPDPIEIFLFVYDISNEESFKKIKIFKENVDSRKNVILGFNW